MGAFDDLPEAGGSNAFADIPVKKKKTASVEDERAGIFGGIPEAAVSLGSGALAGPISGLAGIAGAAFPGPEGQGADWVQKVQDAMTVQPRSKGGKMIVNALGYIPSKIAEGGNYLGEKSADISGSPAVGAEVNAITQMLPMLLGGPLARAASAPVKAGLRGVAESQMLKAINPNMEAMRSGDAARAVQRALMPGDRLNVTQGMPKAARAKVGALEDLVTEALAESNAMAPKAQVVQPIEQLAQKYKVQMAPQEDLGSLAQTKTQFLNHPDFPAYVPEHTVPSPILDARGNPFPTTVSATGTNEIPVTALHEMKQGTYQRLGERAYAGQPEQKSATVAGEKALASGARQTIADLVPEVAGPIKAQSDLLKAIKVMEPEILRQAKKRNIAHINILGGLSHEPTTKALGAFLSIPVGRSAALRSYLAQMLDMTGNAASAAGNTGAPIGTAMTLEADQARKRRLAELLGSR